jgi:hypothetical protein
MKRNEVTGNGTYSELFPKSITGHTDAIKANLIPDELSRAKMNFIYSGEAELLNLSLYGVTSKEWKGENSDKDGNIRDHSTLEQLIVLSNLKASMQFLLIRDCRHPTAYFN